MKLKFSKSKKLLFTIFISLATSFVSNAQLYLKNNTSEPVWVAYAKWNDSKNQNHWFTVGWYKIDPGDTRQLAAGIGFQDYCYYYAETKGGAKKYEGKTKFLVDRGGEFKIKNADKQYQKDNNSNYEWHGFRKFTYTRDLLGTKVKQTIVLEF
jgi:uncharacterized membrane protein